MEFQGLFLINHSICIEINTHVNRRDHVRFFHSSTKATFCTSSRPDDDEVHHQTGRGKVTMRPQCKYKCTDERDRLSERANCKAGHNQKSVSRYSVRWPLDKRRYPLGVFRLFVRVFLVVVFVRFWVEFGGCFVLDAECRHTFFVWVCLMILLILCIFDIDNCMR